MKMVLLFLAFISHSYGQSLTESSSKLVCPIVNDIGPTASELVGQWQDINKELGVTDEFCIALQACSSSSAKQRTSGREFRRFCQLVRNSASDNNECGMTQEEKIALGIYRAAAFRCINSFLRQPNPQPSDPRFLLVQRLNEALARHARYEGFVVRGVRFDSSLLSNYNLGGIVTEQAFTSSSTRLDAAARFSGTAMFLIYSKNGRMIMNTTDSEQEVLFSSNTRFRVLNVKSAEGSNGNSFIVMREITNIETSEEEALEDSRILSLAKNAITASTYEGYYPPQESHDSWQCPANLEDSGNVIIHGRNPIPTNPFFQ